MTNSGQMGEKEGGGGKGSSFKGIGAFFSWLI